MLEESLAYIQVSWQRGGQLLSILSNLVVEVDVGCMLQ